MKITRIILIAAWLAICVCLAALIFSSSPTGEHPEGAGYPDKTPGEEERRARAANGSAEAPEDNSDNGRRREDGHFSDKPYSKRKDGQPKSTTAKKSKGGDKSSKRSRKSPRGETGRGGSAAGGAGFESEDEFLSRAQRLKPGVWRITKEDFQEYINTIEKNPDREPVERKLGIVAGYVVDESGSPVEGALVTLSLEVTSLVKEQSGGRDLSQFPQKRTTDPNGQFWFSNLPYLTYTIKIECEGFLTEYYAAIRLDEKGEVYLKAVLRNSLFVSGIVADPENNPVEGAQVRAMYKIEAGPDFISEMTTGPEGTFVLPVREGSANEVEATKIGYRSARLVSVPPGTTDCRLVLEPIPTGFVTGRVVDAATELPINNITIDGEEILASNGYFEVERPVSSKTRVLVVRATGYQSRNISYKLTQSGKVDLGEIALEIQLTLKGMVAVAESEPPEAVPGATVTVQYAGSAPRTTTTAADGTFSFDGIPSGALTLTAGAKGFFPETKQVTVENYNPEIPASKEVYVLVSLKPGGYAVEGTVTDAGTKGPIPGASLAVVGAPGMTALSDTDGTYKIEGISLESFKVRASKTGYIPATSETLSSDSQGTSVICDFELERGGLHGSLLCSGKPVPKGVTVYLYKQVPGPLNDRIAADRNLAANRHTTATDDDGNFAFQDIPDGTYYIVVPEYQQWPLTVTADKESDNAVVVNLPGVSEVRGKITYDDGTPVKNTSLYFHSGDNDYSIAAYHTDEHGDYVIKNVPIGNCALSIIKSIADQSAQHVVEFTVNSAPLQIANIKFPPLSSSISGCLKDENGNPKPGVQVGVEYLDSPHRAILAGWVLTDGEGRYSVPRLEPGRHIVRSTWTFDETVFSDIIELKAGESKEVNLTAPKTTGKRITGNLITTDGAPLAGSFVFAIDENGRQNGNFFADFNWGYASEFNIKGLKPGNYTLVFTSIGCKKKTLDMTVSTNISNLTVTMESE